jgi:hypothetical protein
MKKLKLPLLALLILSIAAYNQPDQSNVFNDVDTIDISIDSLNNQPDELIGDTTNWKTLEEENYLIEYPEDWSLDTTRRFGSVFMLYADSTDQILENLNLMIFDMEGKSFEEFIEVSEKEIERPDIRKLVESIELNENGMHGFKFVFVSNEGKKDLKVTQYVWHKEDLVYGLTYVCELDQFENYIDTINKIVNSIRLK